MGGSCVPVWQKWQKSLAGFSPDREQQPSLSRYEHLSVAFVSKNTYGLSVKLAVAAATVWRLYVDICPGGQNKYIKHQQQSLIATMKYWLIDLIWSLCHAQTISPAKADRTPLLIQRDQKPTESSKTNLPSFSNKRGQGTNTESKQQRSRTHCDF